MTREEIEVKYYRGESFEGSDLRGADLRWADLRGADLHGADLRWADLRGANLHGVDLRWANLRGADLHGADLRGANLHGADLRWANLHGADLRAADLSYACLGDTVVVQVGPIGSRRDYLVVIRHTDGMIDAKTGCFRGSLARLEKAVAETHGNHPLYYREYQAAIAYVKAVLSEHI